MRMAKPLAPAEPRWRLLLVTWRTGAAEAA